MPKHPKRLLPLLRGLAAAALASLLPLTAIYAETQSERIHVEAEGQGDTIVFVPGLTSSPKAFRAGLTEPLEADARWVTVAGFAGTSPPGELDDFVASAASAVAAHVRDEDLVEVKLVGHSMGGVMSLLVAAEVPDRIDSIMIIDSVPFLPELFQPGITAEAAKAQAAGMRAQFDSMTDEQFLSAMRQGLPRQATGPDAQALVFEDIARSDKDSVVAATAELFSTDFSPVLEKVQAPVTVLVPHNAYLGMTPEQVQARYAALYDGLRNFRIVVIENSRHFVMLDQPAAFEAALADFMEGR